MPITPGVEGVIAADEHPGSTAACECTVAVLVGGDARQGTRRVGRALVRAVASSKFGGNGAHRALIAAIGGGRVQLVVLLTRWLGHSETGAITAACRRAGVRYLLVGGGLSAAWSLLRREARTR